MAEIDTVAKQFIHTYPADFARFALQRDDVENVNVLDTEQPSVRRPDSLLRVRLAGQSVLVHHEFQTTADPAMPRRMASYIGYLIERYGLRRGRRQDDRTRALPVVHPPTSGGMGGQLGGVPPSPVRRAFVLRGVPTGRGIDDGDELSGSPGGPPHPAGGRRPHRPPSHQPARQWSLSTGRSVERGR